MDCLKKLRTQRGLLQRDVAEALRIDRTTYVKYENGKSHPDHEMLKRIAEFYGVSIDYLLDNEPSEKAVSGAAAPQISPERAALLKYVDSLPESQVGSALKALQFYRSLVEDEHK